MMFETKKLYLIFMVAFSAAMMLGCASQNQTSNQSKMKRTVRKEMRHYEKEGWESPQDPPFEHQLVLAFQMTNELDEYGKKKYVIGEAMTVGETYDAARFQAMNLARLDLAGKIETEIAELIETMIDHPESATSLFESVVNCTNSVAQKLGRIITPVDVYRELPNGYVEVYIKAFIQHDQAINIFLETIQEEHQLDSPMLMKMLEKAFDRPSDRLPSMR